MDNKGTMLRIEGGWFEGKSELHADAVLEIVDNDIIHIAEIDTPNSSTVILSIDEIQRIWDFLERMNFV